MESLIDVELVLAEARGAGGTIVQPACRDPDGGSGGSFLDPDGHLWQVRQAPPGPDR